MDGSVHPELQLSDSAERLLGGWQRTNIGWINKGIHSVFTSGVSFTVFLTFSSSQSCCPFYLLNMPQLVLATASRRPLSESGLHLCLVLCVASTLISELLVVSLPGEVGLVLHIYKFLEPTDVLTLTPPTCTDLPISSNIQRYKTQLLCMRNSVRDEMVNGAQSHQHIHSQLGAGEADLTNTCDTM